MDADGSDSRPVSVNVFSIVIAQLLPPAPSVPAVDYTLHYGTCPSAEVHTRCALPSWPLQTLAYLLSVTGADTTPLAEDKKTYVYSVAVTNGKKTYDTPWANECHWEVDFPIEPSDTIHAVSFKLYRTRKNLPIWRHRNLGSASFETQMIEDTEEAGEAKEMKTDMKAEKSTKDSLTLVVKAVGPETSPNANSDPSGTLGAPPNVAHKWNPPDIPENLLENAETLGGMLQLIQPFKEVFDSIAEFHPVAKGAWLVVSGAYQVLKNQHDRDGQLVDLYNLMMKTYEIATENDLYKRVGDKKLCVVIDAMVKQSKECSIFISNYGSRRYLYRILTGSEASTRIQDYKASFSDLQKAFTSSQIDLTARRVLEIESIVLSQESKSKLVELAPSTRSPGAITRCKYGTRQQSLLKITNWITQGDESVFWLNGVAGCGKSSLMGTMIQVIQQMGARSRLAAFIRFDRSAYNEARVVVRELAYQLAFFDSRLGEAIADAFQTTNRILSPDLESQLKQLVLDPLYQCREALEKDGPVTIIFDGLDECKDDDFFRELLTFFSDNVFSSFPHIRVIIASRPEAHICDAFSNADSQDLFPHILQFRLDTSSKETREDIQFYIEKELSSIKEKGFQDLCVQKNAAAELAKRAGGLFIWAVVILNFLRGYACPRLETVLETDPPVDALSALTTLYQNCSQFYCWFRGGHQERSTNSAWIHQVHILSPLL
ncbi:hypothetical protein D9758_003470 [Tetrapyrgos nigripes]|uniref:NACHT domain-containing protein n=1 Tax=Tetrapyrgos nigripes TaxID=182062 RepID=A0A8H5GV39_9AGAR|nr:hypothetical protein D9758_003470 [Tetrapyrgos nigripes]